MDVDTNQKSRNNGDGRPFIKMSAMLKNVCHLGKALDLKSRTTGMRERTL
jgi:hypothetical protein